MRPFAILGFAFVAAALAALPATAADPKDKKKKDGPVLRLAHNYAGAVAEAKERNCVLFASIHAEH